MMKQDLLQIYADSFRSNWDLPALTDYSGGATLTYGDFARSIVRTHIFFQECGIKRGDKIALMGKNTSSWVTIYMATITYGAVIVPILAEFNPADAQHIINHSEAVMLFCSDSVWENLDFAQLRAVKSVMSLDGSRLLGEHPKNSGRVAKALDRVAGIYASRYPSGYGAKDISYPRLPKVSMCEINYTSGSTGFSKGVMLSLNNLCGNVVFGIRQRLHYRGSRCLSFLPLAHAYGCAFDMLTPLACGSHVTLFSKPPTPRLLLKALAEVRPNLIISVPLILEKVYRKQILPQITSPRIKRLLALPIVRGQIYKSIRRKLVEAFGGCFSQIIIGGAPLNPEVEAFLLKIKFPLTVGYGMTECGPLISYTPSAHFIAGSVGQTLPEIMHSRLSFPEGHETPMTMVSDGREMPVGEICVRGENVMMGYYKNPDATAAAIDAEGWLHTGDMGSITPDGTIFIKGRYKTMILSASGQNIYPEEIEAKINNKPYVGESLVVERGPRLVALIYPDYEAMDAAGLTLDKMQPVMDLVIKEVNASLAPYEQLTSAQIVPVEFEKTPKRSIKRYLYK
ncbi:MAG: long-chain fatty acid--CoA ligase [Muribaculaceae bacterium]|jgi:long-chain acyl-CoA synthetase|nr:long-chain fatty acid--CoA ligase [Muribaculaceae bacterium]